MAEEPVEFAAAVDDACVEPDVAGIAFGMGREMMRHFSGVS